MTDHADAPTTVRGIAARLRAGLETPDQALLASLLDAEVRWGGAEETPATCHSRAAVLRWYQGLHQAGVRARVTETIALPHAVILALAVTGPDAASPLPESVYQVFQIRGGLVADIRGVPGRGEALALAAPAQA